MKTLLLILLSAMFSLSLTSQNKTFNSSIIIEKNIEINNSKMLATACNTLYNFNPSAASTTLTVYDLACGGYISGNNCWGETQKAEYYSASTYSSLSSPSVTGCYVYFYRNGNTGTKGIATNTIGLNVYSVSGSGAPSALLGSTSTSIASVTNLFSSSSNICNYLFNFSNPVTIPSNGFFCSVVLPNNNGDTAVVVQQLNATSSNAWEYNPNYSPFWFNMKLVYSGNMNMELCIFPVISCSGSTGINENLMEKYFNVVPNPSNGIFNLISGISDLDFEINITDAMGKLILSQKKISGNPLNEINLSNYPNGIYFLNIRTDNKSITKKLILNR